MGVPATAGYRHRTWDQDMAGTIIRAVSSYQKTEVMIAGLELKQAGRTHLEMARRVRVQAAELVASGVAILRHYDSKYLPVVQTVADNGGLGEVALDKTYHQN